MNTRSGMKFGFVLPWGDARAAAELAEMAERSGWDGFFVWEPVWGFDAWVNLAAAAMVTRRIRLGTLLSPLSRMRPWKLASETVNLDHLSNGRLILSVGLGAVDTGFAEFGEQTDRRIRAELLDEGLEILTGLWRGQPFTFEGTHYRVRPTSFQVPPLPVQQPRIPIWVVGALGSEKSMRRALRYDGLLPTVIDETGQARGATPDEIRAMRTYIDARVPDRAYDIIVEGKTPGDDPDQAREILNPWREAGATWWIEALWDAPNTLAGWEMVKQRIQQGTIPNFAKTE
jgi:alkanesulfonate monooxygenase SsuD/methylene tetrahydromethanopterin reductase-like flavin-dependent oxidoreductase (luciferase family)